MSSGLYHLIKSFRAPLLSRVPSFEAPHLPFQDVNLFIMLSRVPYFQQCKLPQKCGNALPFGGRHGKLTIHLLPDCSKKKLLRTKNNDECNQRTVYWKRNSTASLEALLLLGEVRQPVRSVRRWPSTDAFSTWQVKEAAKMWEENKSLDLSPPPKVRIARPIFFLFYMKHRKNTSETFSDRNRRIHAKHQAGIR